MNSFQNRDFQTESESLSSQTLNHELNYSDCADYLSVFGLQNFSDSQLIKKYLSPEMFVYYCQKSGLTPAETVLRIAEMLKFLILVRNFPGNIIFGKEIDEIWHLWVLQTQEYDALCAALPGGSRRNHSAREYPETPEAVVEMMSKLLKADDPSIAKSSQTEEEDFSHEVPQPSNDPNGERKRYELNAQRILSFFASYYSNFGEIREEVIPFWPPLRRMMIKLGWDREKLNTFLATEVAKAQIKRA